MSGEIVISFSVVVCHFRSLWVPVTGEIVFQMGMDAYLVPKRNASDTSPGSIGIEISLHTSYTKYTPQI